jgi:hypothetical protein
MLLLDHSVGAGEERRRLIKSSVLANSEYLGKLVA